VNLIFVYMKHNYKILMDSVNVIIIYSEMNSKIKRL